jgi:hypothetical protein
MTRREKRRNPVSRSIKKRRDQVMKFLWTVDLAPFRGSRHGVKSYLITRNAEMPKCRIAKLRNKRKSLRIQSNGAGEFKTDRRATVSPHS